MAWTGLTLTVDGRSALNQAQASGNISFKSIVVGDGAAPANFSTAKALTHQLFEIPDLMVEVEDSHCILTADFPKAAYDYYFREVGVIVNTDAGEKLYVYDNCGDDAQSVVSTSGVEDTRKRIRLLLKISDVEHMTVITPNLLYVSFEDLKENKTEIETEINEHKDDMSVHVSPENREKWDGKQETDGDTEENIITFTSMDEAEPKTWNDVALLDSREKHKNIFNKMSTMFRNVRYLYKMLGTTDISSVGDGTTTGAISKLNTDMLGLAGESVKIIYREQLAEQRAVNITDYHIVLICLRMTVASNPLLIAVASWYGNPKSPSGTIISPIIGNAERFQLNMIHDDSYVYIAVVPNSGSIFFMSVIGLYP